MRAASDTVIALMHDKAVAHACAVPGAAQPAVLDFGLVVDAIMVGEMGRLSLNNITLVNAAPRHVPHTDTHARYKIATFGPYPSITVLPNATVGLHCVLLDIC